MCLHSRSLFNMICFFVLRPFQLRVRGLKGSVKMLQFFTSHRESEVTARASTTEQVHEARHVFHLFAFPGE